MTTPSRPLPQPDETAKGSKTWPALIPIVPGEGTRGPMPTPVPLNPAKPGHGTNG